MTVTNTTLTDTDKTRVIESHGMLQDLTVVVQQIRERQEVIEAKVDRIDKRGGWFVRVWSWTKGMLSYISKEAQKIHLDD